MRVLNISGSLKHGGGIESVLLRAFTAMPELPQLRESRAAAPQVEICYVGRRTPTMTAEFERLGIQIWRCPESRWPIAFSRRLARELRRRGPYDVVHTHNSNFGGVALRVAEGLGIPRRVAQYHNLTSGHANNAVRRMYEWWLRRLVLRHATAICPVAAGIVPVRFGELLNGDSRLRVLPAGLPIDQFALTDEQRAAARSAVRAELGIPSTAPVIGHVGRFVRQKNHVGLIEAARIVATRMSDSRFLLVGDGDLRRDIEQRVAAAGLAGRFVFTGVRSDVPRLYAAMDVLFLPSIEEGLGVVLLEAQAVGVPVIASRLSTTQDAVAPEFRALTHPPNATGEFADELRRMLERLRDPRTAMEIGAAARRYGRSFTAEASARAFLEVWGGGGQSPA